MSFSAAGLFLAEHDVIGPFSDSCVGQALRAWNQSPGSVAWTANKAIFYPWTVSEPVTVVRAWWLNGSVAGGNIDLGIYRASDYGKVVSTGATARGTTSTINSAALTSTLIVPGDYLIALACDSGTANFTSSNLAGGLHGAVGCLEQSTAYTLPSTATPTGMATACLPMCGVMLTTVGP